MASVLAVVAHPDDEILGCGGTLALHAERGDSVTVLILGEGMRSRDEYAAESVDELHAAARAAASELGIDDVRLEQLPDNAFDSVPLLDVVKLVESTGRSVEPAVVYTHHPGDLNVDHGITTQAVLTAFRPLPGTPARTLLAFETLSSSEWNYAPGAPRFRPQWYVDIGGVLERKIRALEAYRTEIRDYPHPRSSRGLEIASRRVGMDVGLEHAEAFEVLRVGPGPLPA
ncbi:MAG TPA: PIG-L deacetylase family protein [Gaiellaceae bacterium]|nr:PIG-L deacetylase family protein [Gaiellaceae bacterium]